MFFSQTRSRAWGAWAAMLLLCQASAAWAGEAQVLEGFEDLSKVTCRDGKLKAMGDAAVATEGRQAARLPAGASIELKVPALDYHKKGWLRIDTHRLSQLPQTLAISLRNQEVFCSVRGTVGNKHPHEKKDPEKEVLSLPVCVVEAGIAKTHELTAGELTLTITNVSQSDIILDNVRLEEAAAPTGCTPTSFGEVNWPGFSRGSAADVTWSGKQQILPWGLGFPNPLVGRYLGMWPNDGCEDYFTVAAPGKGRWQLWMWVTHYGLYDRPAREWWVKVNGQKKAQGELNAARMLASDEWLFEGRGGEWTPEWFDAKYSRKFYELVKVDLSGASARVDVRDCQLAAIAVVGDKQKKEMEAFAQRVGEELSCYHRQFVVGRRLDNICELTPAAEDTKAGLMAFAIPEGDNFPANFAATRDNQAKSLEVSTYNGGTAVLALAVAPVKAVKRAGALTATLGPLRGTGRAAPRAELLFVHRVPRVIDGAVEFKPYVLSRKAPALKEMELAQLAVVVSAPAAAGGKYSGNLRLTCEGGSLDLPVTVDVVSFGDSRKDVQPTAGAMSAVTTSQAWGALGAKLSPARQDEETREMRQVLVDGGINALALPAVAVYSDLSHDDKDCMQALGAKALPPKALTGQVIFDLGATFYSLDSKGITPNSNVYNQAVSQAVAATDAVAKKAGLNDWCYGVGQIWTEETIAAMEVRCKAVAAAKGKPALTVYSALLTAPSPKLKALMAAASVLVVDFVGYDIAPGVAAFRQNGPDRRVLILTSTPRACVGGFWAWGIGADGMYYSYAFLSPGPYNGFNIRGSGLLSPETQPLALLPMLAIRQGASDMTLVRRAEALAKEALARKGKDNADVARLQAVLNEVAALAKSLKSFEYDTRNLRSASLSGDKLTQLRQKLLAECAAVAKLIGD